MAIVPVMAGLLKLINFYFILGISSTIIVKLTSSVRLQCFLFTVGPKIHGIINSVFVIFTVVQYRAS